MVIPLARNWWTLALRGLVAVLFGVAAFGWPGLTLVSLMVLFGAFAFADGTFALAAAVAGRACGPLAWILLTAGLLGLGFGINALLRSGTTAPALVDLIAGWAVTTGALQIAAAVALDKEFEDDWLLVLGGALSVGFGLAMVAEPSVGARPLIGLIGANALVFGIFQSAIAIRLRALALQSPISAPGSRPAGGRIVPDTASLATSVTDE